jgi:hypothetical protein
MTLPQRGEILKAARDLTLYCRVGEASSKDIINVLKHLQRIREMRGPSGEKAFVCTCV